MNIAGSGSIRVTIGRFLAPVGLGLFATIAQAQFWGTFQANAQHNGYVPIEVSAANISQLWQAQLPGAQISQAACGSGMLFVTQSQTQVGSYSSYSLYGIDETTGGVDWAEDWIDLDSLTPPTLYGGYVYVQSLDTSEHGLISCFYANGDFGWRQPFNSQWGSWPAPTADNGVVYFAGGTYGGEYAFGALDGTDYWFCNQLMQYTGFTPSLDATYAYSYTGPDGGSYQAGLYAVNRVTGNADYQIYDAGNVWNGYTGQTPAISGNLAFVANTNRLIAFDLKHRNIAWQTTRQCTGQPDAVGNAVYVADGNGLSAFDASNGKYLWSWIPSSGAISGQFAITNNMAFVSTTTGGYDSTLTGTVGIDLTTHQQTWTTSVFGQLSVGDGNLYISGPTGLLTAFSLGALGVVEPASYQIVRGIGVSGNLASIQSVDDQVLKVLTGPTLTSQDAPVQVVVTGTSPSLAPAQLTFHLQAFAGTPGVTQSIELWNYSTSQWDLIGTMGASTSESVQEATASNPATYIQAGTGQMQTRISWKATGPTLFYVWPASIDQAVWLEG